MTTYAKADILPAFYFFNRCLNARLYPRRPLQRREQPFDYRPCRICGSPTINQDVTCNNCRAKLGEIRDYREREKLLARSVERIELFSDTLKTCRKRGVCDILSAHHTFLANDPDRLTTEFLVKMVCKKEYEPGSKMREVVLEDEE